MNRILSNPAAQFRCAGFSLLLVCLFTVRNGYSQNVRETVAVLQDDQINEASGLVLSRDYPGYFWTHNDSGDQARLFAIDSLGTTVHTVYLDGVVARDWEDLSIMEDDEGNFFLLVAEIGDNVKKYSYYAVHKIPEPDIHSAPRSRVAVQTLNFRYEDGPQNAETLAYDAKHERLVVANKGDTKVNLYELPLSFSASDTLEAKVFGSLVFDQTAFGGPSSQGGVGGDVYDGILLVKSYDNIYTIDLEKLESGPRVLPYTLEVQGEALAFSTEGSFYYTLSEERGGVPATLYRYPYSNEPDSSLSLPDSFDHLSVEKSVKLGEDLKLSFKLKKSEEVQVYVSSGGSPIHMLLDEKVKEAEMVWNTEAYQKGKYQLLFVSDSFTLVREIEVW